MPRIINVGRLAPGTTAPEVRPLVYANGQTFLQGSPLVMTAGVASECAANPTSIAGFAASPYNGNAGYQSANSPAVITGLNQDVPTFVANSGQQFTSTLVNASAVPVTVTQAMVGVITYGLSKQTINGRPTWVVDQAATACVQITDVDVDGNFVYFKVLVANRQVI